MLARAAEDRPTAVPAPNFDVVASLAKRRGFVFPSSEIYGGMAGFWDYGPLGVELKNNVKAAWWRHMVQLRDDVVGIDAAIIMNPRVWEASGHVAGFSDPMVDCRSCQNRFREDDLKGPPSEIACPNCGNRGSLTEARQFNLMFATTVGPVADSSSVVAYLRPETAQAMFVQFDNVATTTRRKLPFGIAQMGRSFRNEITPGNFIFRLREFEQMEMEFFVPPGEADDWYEQWMRTRFDWYTRYGIRAGKLRLRPHEADELSHYSSATSDVEYEFPIGWSELEGIANRGDFDLTQHANASGEKLEYFDQQTKDRYVPHVIEPAAGVGRSVLAFLCDAYEEETVAETGETRTVLRLHPALAPVKVAVLPLVKKDGQPEVAREIVAALRGRMTVEYDEGGSIGKRYRRQDEIGTPYGVTVDHQTLEDRTVTVRDRDSLAQERLPIDGLAEALDARLRADWLTPKA